MSTTFEVRKWLKCGKCGSATLASFIQASGLCKVCDARRLAEAMPVVHRMDHDGKRGEDAERTSLESMGLDTLHIDDDADHVVYDEDGNIDEEATRDAQELAREKAARSSRIVGSKLRTKQLEEEADALLEADAAEQRIRELGQADASQFLVNKARDYFGIELIDIRFGRPDQPATIKQLATLVKLGHDELLVKQARLSLPEASRILQRGPRWKWK